MWKKIIKSVLFCSGLLIILLGLSVYFMPQKSTRDTGATDILLRSITYETPDTLDAVVLGDSEAYASFIPLQVWQQYGITSYISATPLQGINSTVKQLETILKTQKPKVVIFETNGFFTNISRMAHLVNFVQDYLPVLKYHNRWKPRTTPLAHDYDLFLGGKGYKFMTDVAPADTSTYKDYSSEVAEIKQINLDYFDELVELCREHNIKLVMVSTPTTKNWNYSRHNALELVAKKYDLTYFDLNLTDEVVIDFSKDTYDRGDHLNYFGATQVTNFIGKYLAQLNIFEDKRQNTAYQTWNQLLETISYMKNPPVR